MIIVIGSFDGFHTGHQALFNEAAVLAEELGVEWRVLTFSPHPQLLFPGRDKRLLFTEKERESIAKYLSIPGVIKIPFTEKVAGMDPEEFVNNIEKEYIIHGIVVGKNFRFGYKRQGNVDCLALMADRKGWAFRSVDILKQDGNPVSSTMIRGLVGCGLMENALKLLGYPFFIRNKVVAGDRRGRLLGYPTANIDVPDHKVIPPDGVYACSVIFENKIFPAAVNIGFNPTFFDVSSVRIEAHLIDFDEDLYGKDINVVFWKKIRGEISFNNLKDLSLQIGIDADEALEISKEKVKTCINLQNLST